MDILLVEDHHDIAENIADYCEAAGHDLALAVDGVTALRMLQASTFDVVILDVMLPRMDGLTCLQQLREKNNTVPVLMLTARDTLEDKLAGFAAGADDYLVKPFALPELLVRLEALYRRAPQEAKSEHFTIGDLELDVVRHSARRGGRVLQLNRTCFSLLAILARYAPQPVSRHTLEQELWGDERPDSDALRTHIYHLRQIVDKPFNEELLHTVRGVGLRLGPSA